MFGLKNRVKETTATTGTGNITLAGAATGYKAFSASFSNGDKVYYCIDGGSEWEVGYGTFNSGGPTISRDVVLDSSNSGSLVNFSSGTKSVFCTLPGERVGLYKTEPENMNSGTEKIITGLPAGIQRLTIQLSKASTTGSQNWLLQLGDSGGIENTSYDSGVMNFASTGGGSATSRADGFVINSGGGSNVLSGSIVLTRMGKTSNKWILSGGLSLTGGNSGFFGLGGEKTLSDELTQFRLAPVSTDSWDGSGTIACIAEF
jgi:hypothetical protein